MEKQNDFEVTEDFTELLEDKTEVTEQLDVVNNEKTEELIGLVSNPPKFERNHEYNFEDVYRKSYPDDEKHISDIDEDFSDVVRRRKNKENDEPSKHGKKIKLKKWVYVVILLFLLGGGFGAYKFIHDRNVAKKQEEEKRIIENIEKHYSDYVKVVKDTTLYEEDGNNFKEVGTIYEGVKLALVEEDIHVDTKYFHIKDLDYYISYEDVEEIEEFKKDDRYKNYLPFNINIVTKDEFTMYLDDEKLLSLNETMEFPVIINNFEDKYYVEYKGMLVSIKKDDVKETKENKNTDKKNQAKITTLAYHRVYTEGESCTDGYVCIKQTNFDKQMKYLADNDYFTLSLMEFYMYMKGSLQIEKGVFITLDDGLMFRNADDVLDKYHLKATGFVTTSLGVDTKDYKAIEAQSHTHDLHRNYVCSGGNQGGAILCSSKEKIVADLKKAIEILGTEPIALAYPFYDYNDNAIAALKEVGYKMGFVGRAGVLGKATPKVTDLYKIPRMTVWEENIMSFNEWKSYL